MILILRRTYYEGMLPRSLQAASPLADGMRFRPSVELAHHWIHLSLPTPLASAGGQAVEDAASLNVPPETHPDAVTPPGMAAAAVMAAAAPARGAAFAAGTVLDPDTAILVNDARSDIGTRVERALATIALRTGAILGKEGQLQISAHGVFAPNVATALSQSLGIDAASPILSALHDEIAQFASTGALTGPWGSVTATSDGLVLMVPAPEKPVEADRPRAQVVGGLAKKT